MTKLVRIFLALGIAGCSSSQPMRSSSAPISPSEVAAPAMQPGSLDSVAQYLIASAATDFHDHGAPGPIRVRTVRLGHFVNADGATHYVLCGQLLRARPEGTGEWTPFATIKTSGYEQWLGVQASSYCQERATRWDSTGNLTASLQGRVDALR